MSGESQNNVGIYVHIPFCEKKCFYCDFYSIENHSQRSEFIHSLIKEIELFSRTQPRRYKADTIFFGGGTPSLLSPAEIGSILDALIGHFDICADSELTLECNPGTISRESLSGYRHLGINRLSFGIQSFFDDELKFLSRIHDSKQAVEAIAIARESGFVNLNIDVMYGLPDQTRDRVLTNLNRTVELSPEHISAYNLIVEQGTPLFSSVASGKTKLPDESAQADMYELTMAFLDENGYGHYEISNYSRPGRQCKHNLKYWNSNDYVSFGPSAHSFLNNTRWWNASSLSNYISELAVGNRPISATEDLSSDQLFEEFVMLQLRQGTFDTKMFGEKFGYNLDSDFVSELTTSGYAEKAGEIIYLKEKGFLVNDEIVGRILSRHNVVSQTVAPFSGSSDNS